VWKQLADASHEVEKQGIHRTQIVVRVEKLESNTLSYCYSETFAFRRIVMIASCKVQVATGTPQKCCSVMYVARTCIMFLFFRLHGIAASCTFRACLSRVYSRALFYRELMHKFILLTLSHLIPS
jgi:hypothetical protein